MPAVSSSKYPPSRKGSAFEKKMCERDRKPSSVVDDHLSRSGVTAQTQAIAGRDGQPHASHCILHQVGFTSRTSRQAVGELLPRLSILARGSPGRYISVALSLESPPPAVNRHPALRCSDFPHTFRHAIAWSPRTVGMIPHFRVIVKPWRLPEKEVT